MASTNAHNFEASTSYFLLGQTAAQQNSKYKSYAAAVDKALKSFESTTEWADLIAALGKLGKVFSSHSKTFNDIPNSLTVSKRLSQCLHPALPSGVHLKALDTYRQIFLILGRTQNLARYLFLYASGLFPLMDHCGIKVKSELLSIFEQFLLPLGPDLRPALPGFVATLLLALEEGTEFYMRAFNLLDQLIEKVGTDAFYTCFWQAVSENLSARLPALIFINAKIEKHKSNDFFRTISAGGQKTTAHMLRALCCAADDSGSALTQRHLLDFLCTTLPLNSDRISKQNLIQLLQHCLFVLLRRDMSLNRRLYQWLLNRSNDMAFVGLPVNGVEDSIDLAFFKENALPLIGAAIRDYLAADIEALPVVTIKPTVAGVVMGKGAQVHHAFPEVRVIRLFHYMLDRPELGQLVLQESLADLLEVCCTRNSATIIQQLQAECELIDPAFGNFLTVILPSMEFEPAKDLEQQKLQEKREEEIRKNLNALLNSMEPSFLWKYFETLFTRLSIPNNGDGTEEINDEMPEDAANALESTRVRYLFPLMVLYALKHIQLDHHGDIRGRHLPNLLRHILHTMGIGSAAFSNDNLIAIVILCRHLLVEITQNNVSVVFESIQESVDMSPSKRNVKCNKELAEEQKLVEAALEACLHLLFTICKSYAQSRDRNQIGLLTCISTLVRDFADFPFYSLQSVSSQQSSCRSLTDSIRDLSIGQNNSSSSLNWLHAIYFVIDPPTWRTSSDEADFGMRSKLLDLLLYLCLRSASMIEQHLAVFGRSVSQKSAGQPEQARKTTTTVLLKPFLSQYDLIEVEKDAIFKASALVLWQRFSENSDILWLQMVALLLLRLHSRRINESSSEIEDLIVGELTSANKMASGAAARKFRDLWIFTRSSQIEEVYSGIPLKPMNRVIMVLLGFITDDSLAVEQIELKALAFSWLEDCSRNNELHKVLQMLTLMLLNPTTARVSIQFVQMWQRITQEQLPSLPANANCVSLTTVGGKQTFHHICTDVDTTPLPRHENMCLPLHCAGNSWTEYNYISCDPRQPWVSELNRLLLLPSNTDSLPFQQQKQQQNHQQLMDAKIESPGNNHNKMEQQSQLRKTTHNRTLSDIPQFDNDVESMDSFSLDTSIDQEVLDTIQHMVDAVCEPCEFDSRKDGEEEAEEDEQQQQHQEDNKLTSDNSSTTLVAEEVFEQANKFKAFREQCVSSATEADDISVVGSLVTNNAAAMPRLSTYGSGDTIKRIRTGHRRQDSLQESIFSTSTQELRLFDPTELPNSTCPGDHKQPLLDETFSHMLFYAENPSMVDLGRAEKLFRTIGTLFKSDGIGRQIVSCMLFTNLHNNQASPTGGGGEPLLDSPGGPSASVAQQLMDFMARHYRHIQGDEFWDLPAPQEKEGGDGTAAENNKTTAQQQQRQSTLFEIFSTVVLYFFRSYFLNSPTNHVSEDDLVLAWKCKIAALDCFTELLRILDGIVKDMAAKEFATFVQHIYRQTKAQKVILTLMLAAIPTPPSQKGWKMPLTMDIAEFNNGPRNKDHFRDLIFAYHRSLLHLANSIVVLEYSLLVGMRYFHAQVSGGVPANFNSQQQITENQINYNSSQTRSTIREARYSVVELRLFLGVILNALKRCPERHELWLQFLIGILPYLDRALATFVVHSVEQICRNMYECMHKNFNETWTPTMSSPMSANPRSPIQFVDYRCARTNDNGNSSRRATVKYPANYILMLMESLMSILHSTVLDGSSLFFVSPQVMARNMATPFGSPYSQFNISTTTLPPSPNRGPSSISTQSGGGFSSSNMTSMVGSAISVIPGTGLINNLFGRVFTSADSGINSASMRNESAGKTAEWLEAQKELIKMLPSILAIMSDIWTHATVKEESTKSAAAIVAYKPLSTLILNILDPIVKKHKAVLINSLGTVWRFRCADSEHKHNFVYSAQQVSIAKLALKLKSLSLNSVILSISDTLKEIINKTKSGGGAPVEKVGNFSLEVSLLEMLQECTRHVPVAELRDSWCALSLLLGESPLGQLPARASFLAFMILVHFVRRCGAETILEDRLISKSILEVCQRLIDSLNSIVAWQLESTTWLKRTLVVRQDAAGQKAIPDLSPILDQKSTASALSASALPSSETSSIRDSTISLAGIPPSRLSTALDAQQPLLGPGSGIDMKKSTSSLRSSLKDSSSHGGGQGNKRDPTDSTQAIAILAEHLTELVDSITKSEDKDKLLPSLQAVWNNTLPYLKSKSAKNVRSFLAGSQLLASISSFQYMRPIWKKNALELLCDNCIYTFFKMDIQSLRQWLTVIDNLMTNDKSSFKELLARITTSTSTTLTTLITSKEQEYEMRSQYLKRLAFVILSSELDQYSGQLNEIQERLTENLRLCQTPTIHTQVFTCYRVLLVRMSPSSFVSIWPSMITELIQVLAQIEQHLSVASPPALDEQRSAKDEQCLQLFLAGCKLLETLCSLPSGYVAQFQLCRWTFVSPTNARSMSDLFVPYAVRLNRLLNIKYGELTPEDLELRSISLFNVKTMTSLQELHPLFNSLALQNEHLTSNGLLQQNGRAACQPLIRPEDDDHVLSGSLPLDAAVSRIEHSLYVDFAEHWQL